MAVDEFFAPKVLTHSQARLWLSAGSLARRIKGSSATLTVAGQSWTNPAFGVDVAGDTNGPQLGVYSFDYSGSKRTVTSAKLTIGSFSGPGGSAGHHTCQFNCLRDCAPLARDTTTTDHHWILKKG